MGGTVIRLIRGWLHALSIQINRILSWSGWVPALLIGSFTGMWFHASDLVMLILTIQTSVDAAATKTLQSDVRAADEKKDELLRQQIAEVRRHTDILIDMMSAAQRRDELAAKRDKMMLTALENRHDLLEFLGKEVSEKHEQRKAPNPSGRKRASNRRTTRKKP